MGRRVTESENLTIRVGADAKRRWAEAAQRDGRTLTEWTRRVLDAAAARQAKKSTAVQ